MDDPERMGCSESVTRLREPLQYVLVGGAFTRLQELVESLALQQLKFQRDEELSTLKRHVATNGCRNTDVPKGDNIGMRERLKRLRLFQEARAERLVPREMRCDYLDCAATAPSRLIDPDIDRCLATMREISLKSDPSDLRSDKLLPLFFHAAATLHPSDSDE